MLGFALAILKDLGGWLLTILRATWPYLLSAVVGAYGWHRFVDEPKIAAAKAEIAALEDAGRKAQAAQDAKAAADAAITKKVQDEATEQINSMGATLADLSVRLDASNRAGQVRNAIGTCRPDAAAGRPATTGPGADKGAAVATGSGVSAAIDPAVLRDTLDTAAGALTAELLWREWATGTGQVK